VNDEHLDGYDALLLLSFGGPDGPDDVMPFLRNVTAGRNVPDVRLDVVAEQSEMLGGRSLVSYTHLRAYETELDIVCRLLFENPNIINMYQ